MDIVTQNALQSDNWCQNVAIFLSTNMLKNALYTRAGALKKIWWIDTS